MRKPAFTLVIMAFFLIPPASPSSGSQTDNITVVSLPFNNDLYIAGGSIVVTEKVDGDLLAAGGSLVVNAPIGADLQAAGGTVIINDAVGDDIRAVGGEVTLASSVGGDVLIYGGSVTIPAGVEVKGDAILGSGTLHLGGTVHGNLRVDAGTANFSGTVLGDAQFYGDDQVKISGQVDGDTVFAAREVILGPNAAFRGDVVYWSSDGEIDFGQVPVAGNILFDPELEREEPRGVSHGKEIVSPKGIAAVFSVFFFGTLLSGILAIAVGTILFRRTVREAGDVLHLSFWKGFGVGILTYLLLPVAAVIAMLTLVGIPIGLVLLTLFLFSLFFGRVITAMVFAAWVERRKTAQWSLGRLMLAAMGLFLVLKLAALVPFLGWFIVLLATLAGYGALVVALLESRKSTF
jgi:cytoskeletal protein CcmA (bactofilin family)